MVFRHGLISFLIIIVTSLILIMIGIVLLAKYRNGVNIVRVLNVLLILVGLIIILFSKKNQAEFSVLYFVFQSY